MIGRISKVRKRDGRLVDFDEAKIADAIFKAACAVGGEDRFLTAELAGVVTLFLEKRYSGGVPGIEEIQDMVEQVLIETGHARMAKAYILYRERRARAREQVSVHGDGLMGPSVGSPARARVSAWSKARITEALAREADLDEKVAADVASRVEEKVFRCGLARITTGAIRSLVEAELLLMGYSDRVGRQALVGLPRYDIDRLLRGGREAAWPVSDPRDLKRTVADSVLAQYALAEVYSAEVVDAHLAARIHITDVGCPFEWVGAAVEAPACDEEGRWIDATALMAARLGALVTRELTIGGIGAGDAGQRNALAAARRLLGHSALRTLDQRGGRFRLVLSLAALPTGALKEALVREHWARFRNGDLESLPEIVLQVPAGRVDSDEGRRVLLPALAGAAETGRLRIVMARGAVASLVTPWYSVPGADVAGPAALPVAGSVALNLEALDAEGEAALTDALDGALDLALKTLRQKRNFLAALQADPGAPLYRVAAGARPLIAGDAGHDLVCLVGVRALSRRHEREPAAAARLAGRLRSYAAVRLAEEARKVRLKACLAPDRDGEAARRFFGEGAHSDLERYALPAEVSLGAAEPMYEPVSKTVVLRFPREAAPPPETLFDALGLLARDPRVRTLRLLPWPDRSVRASGADL